MRLLFVAIAVYSLSVPSRAQSLEPVEISPFAGYFLGGTIFDYKYPGSQDLSFANHVIYGVRVGWNATRHLEPEFEWSRTETEFSPAQPEYLHSLNVDYFLGGASYNFGSSQTRPYVSVDFGAARIDAINYVAQTLFTISVGAGVKHFFTPHFGLRLDARGYTSMTPGQLKRSCTEFSTGDDGHVEPSPCAHDWLLNGNVSGGLLIAF